MKASFRIAAVAAVAAFVSASAFAADVPLWRKVKGAYSEHQILVDPRIVGDRRLAFLLEQSLKSAEAEARSWEEFASDEIKAAKDSGTTASPRTDNDSEETLRLLAATDRYAAILGASAECHNSCSSGQFVRIYRISRHMRLKPSEILEFDGQMALLNRLVERDDQLGIGAYPFNCDQSRGADEANCVSLSDLLDEVTVVNGADGDERRFKTPADIKRFAKKIDVGFTTDDGGHVSTIDIYFSHAPQIPTHTQVYKWTVDAKLLAPLLKPELRDLVAAAADPKSDASIKTKTIEVRVFLDDKIKADAALSADCLAEGKKWIDKNAADAQASLKQDPQLFRDGAWAFARKYAIRSVAGGRYVSIVRSDYMDTHGAHPNSDVDTILWDSSQNKRISIRPFFSETADNGPTMMAMLKGVIAALNIEKKKRETSETATPEWYKSLEPKLLKIGAVTLAPSTETGKSSGLTFHYPPYAVGPYAEGEYVAFVPWETLKPYLTPEGLRIFGGVRPKGDAATDGR